MSQPHNPAKPYAAYRAAVMIANQFGITLRDLKPLGFIGGDHCFEIRETGQKVKVDLVLGRVTS